MASPKRELQLDESVASCELAIHNDKQRKQTEYDEVKSNSFDDEKYSLRSRASLLLCRPQRHDTHVTSIGQCFGETNIFEQNNLYRREEKVAFRKASQPPLTDLQFESEPLLRKEKKRAERKMSTFDKFVEERYVDAEAVRGSKDKAHGHEEKEVESHFIERNFDIGNFQAVKLRHSKYSLTRTLRTPVSKLPQWPPREMQYPQNGKSRRQRDHSSLHELRTVAVVDSCDADDISVLTDDVVLQRASGEQNRLPRQDAEAQGCFGISLPTMVRGPTIPQSRSSNSETTPPISSKPLSEIERDSPKSVTDDRMFASGYESTSDRKLLKVQRELNAVLRRSAGKNSGSALLGESNAQAILADLEKVPIPELLELRRGVDPPTRVADATEPHVVPTVRRHRVRFAYPAVTVVNVRPFTTPEEKTLLYFDPEELLNLEEDRANRIPGEQFECIVTPSGSSFNVAVSIPKVLVSVQGQKQPTSSSRLFEV
jgi:hypothetical protein